MQCVVKGADWHQCVVLSAWRRGWRGWDGRAGWQDLGGEVVALLPLDRSRVDLEVSRLFVVPELLVDHLPPPPSRSLASTAAHAPIFACLSSRGRFPPPYSNRDDAHSHTHTQTCNPPDPTDSRVHLTMCARTNAAKKRTSRVGAMVQRRNGAAGRACSEPADKRECPKESDGPRGATGRTGTVFSKKGFLSKTKL